MVSKRRVLMGAALLQSGRGGIARIARMTALALAAGGHAVTVVSLLDDAPTDLPGVRVLRARGSRLRFVALCHREALAADLVLFDSAGIARARPRLPGLRRPYAVWMLGLEAWEGLASGARRSFRDAARVLAISHHTLARHEALHGPLPQARVCWGGTECDTLAETARRDGPPTVLILGRIVLSEGGKGHVELIASWPKIVARVPQARLLIAGDGVDLDRIRAMAAASPAAAQIEILGHVDESQIERLWARADVFAMPSRSEGFGLVFAEAMRHGLPVIASRQDGGFEVNNDGETGFCIDLAEPDALCDGVVALLSDAALRQRMGHAAAARWQQHFRFSIFRERLLAQVAELTDSA